MMFSLWIGAEVDKRTSRRLQLHGLVAWNGRLFFLRGFDPMSAAVPRAYVEDAETGEPRTVLLREVVHEVLPVSAA